MTVVNIMMIVDVKTGGHVVAQVVQRARRAKNWDQSELARRAGVSSSYLNKLEHGRFKRPSAEYLGRVLGALGLTVDEVQGARVPVPSVRTSGEVAFVTISRYMAHAGGENVWQPTGNEEVIPLELARETLRAVRVIGDCMAPQVEPGDVVVFDVARRQPENGELVLVSLPEGDLLVKRVQHDRSGRVVLVSNDDPPMRINGTALEGVVVRVVKIPGRVPGVID